VVGRDGSVDFTGTEARELLNRYLGAGSHVRLPQAVHDWFRRESTRLNGDGGLRRATCPLTVQRGERRLVVRLVSDVLLVREEPRPLTPREYEILGLVAEGRSNAEIAASLWLSTGTVRIHLQHIYAKLGVRSRTAALARARQLKSVQPDRS
jgi:ATP/maltotriose-dependent transcriptional regulator MalT